VGKIETIQTMVKVSTGIMENDVGFTQSIKNRSVIPTGISITGNFTHTGNEIRVLKKYLHSYPLQLHF
jgi:hypothetical protein